MPKLHKFCFKPSPKVFLGVLLFLLFSQHLHSITYDSWLKKSTTINFLDTFSNLIVHTISKDQNINFEKDMLNLIESMNGLSASDAWERYLAKMDTMGAFVAQGDVNYPIEDLAQKKDILKILKNYTYSHLCSENAENSAKTSKTETGTCYQFQTYRYVRDALIVLLAKHNLWNKIDLSQFGKCYNKQKNLKIAAAAGAIILVPAVLMGAAFFPYAFVYSKAIPYALAGLGSFFEQAKLIDYNTNNRKYFACTKQLFGPIN